MYEFTEDDLNSNKRGFLTQGQRNYLKMIGEGGIRLQKWNIRIAVAIIIIGIFLTLGLYLQNEGTRAALFSNPMNLLWFPVIVLIIAGLLTISVLFARGISNRLQNAQLRVAEGKIRLDQEYNPGAAFTSHYVFVGKKKFSFSEDMAHIFTEGEKYRVFYVKASAYELIMSFEKA